MPIYYEGRLAKLELSEAERPKIDLDFEEVTEGEEVERKEGLKSKWAQLAAVVGSEKWLKLVDKSKSSPNTGRRRRTRPMSDVEGR